jgi:hypothetical protein
MIDMGGTALHADGVTLFPDHANPGLFHYLPDSPRLRLRADGTPELSLLKYRLDSSLRDALGAGLLSMTVDLAVDPEVLARLRRRAARHVESGTPIEVTPVAADRGTCELTLIDRSSGDAGEAEGAGFGLVERILGAASPSLYGANAATFQAVLSAEGLALVEGALRGGGLPAGVVYVLDVPVLRPAIRAEITARWHDVYRFYENRFHGGRLLVAADIGPTMERLVHDELITIHVDDLVPAGERNEVYDRALDQAQRYVLNRLFKPTLGQTPPPDDGGSDGPLQVIGRTLKDIVGLFSFTYSLRRIDRHELKTFRYQLAAAQAEHLTLAPQGTFRALTGGDDHPGDPDRLITVVEPAASAEMRFDVATNLDLNAEGIDRIEVVLAYGAREERVLLDAAAPRQAVTFWFEERVGPAVTWRYECHFRPDDEGLSDRLQSAEHVTSDRVIRINPRELYQRLRVHAVAQGVPFDDFPTVLVDLEATDPVDGWTARRTLELTSATPEAAFGVRAALDAPVRFRRRLRYVKANGAEIVKDWEPTPGGVLVAGHPQPAVHDLLILGSARFGTAVRRLILELRPNAAPDALATRILTAEEPSATWSWPAAEGDDRGYEHRVTVHMVSGEIREGRWAPGTPGKLIVGEGGSLRQVELILVGKSLEELGLLALKVRFAFRDDEAGLSAEDERLVEETRQPIRWSYPVASPDRQAYTCQLTLIRRDGTVEPRDPITSSDLMLVVPLT